MDVKVNIDHNFHQINNKKLEYWESQQPQEYYDYRKAWYENPKNNIVGKFPLHIDIEATSNCNLLCTMCPRTEMVLDGTFWKVQNIDFELYKKIIDEGSKNGLKSIKYNLLGEPLLNTKLIDMIKYAKDKGLVDIMFNTNATALTEKKSIELINSGLTKMFFSFDSPYREEYNKIRVNSDYDKVLNNIKRFHIIRNEMSSINPFTRVSMIKFPNEKDSWNDFCELFTPIVDTVAYVDYIEHTNIRNDCDYTLENDSNDYIFCCPQLWQRMFVHPDGVVNICCVDGSGGRKIKIGNVHKSSIEDIWTSDRYNMIRKMHRTGKINNMSICRNCHLAKTK